MVLKVKGIFSEKLIVKSETANVRSEKAKVKSTKISIRFTSAISHFTFYKSGGCQPALTQWFTCHNNSLIIQLYSI